MLTVRSFAGIVAVSLAVAGVAGAGPRAGASPGGCRWDEVQPPGNGTLQGVAVLASCQAFAVGGISSTLIERFSGGSWEQQPSPSPGEINSLAAVAATSATSAWAVGTFGPAGGSAEPLTAEIVHWDGTSWTESTVPQPGGASGQSALFGIAARSATRAWAVGSYDRHTPRRTLIMRWNGRSWKQVPSPSPGGPAFQSRLTSVAEVSPGDARAVGWYQAARHSRQTLILHWNGTAWRQVSSPEGPTGKGLLFGVAATSPRDAWAVGHSVPGGSALI